ncbi:hypothetical protein [Mangrovihabitans endophyticus]|uniref:Lipoprotein n=1 Tax=Mangrovihabitans endophyticus TaxID=1751298 RepID=A0A8J3C3D9_9ACTN|nr:hypothetical protein [Mangrovihabitans endophyticus]GGL12903.1 hypothetical protein GCM10012284_54440 [Mangrovihabitans endophyticus]
MRLRSTTASLLGAVLATFALASCSTEDKVQPTDTRAEAKARVEQLARAAFAALPDGASLQHSDGVPCDDPTDNGPAGRIFVEHRYNLVPPTTGQTWPADQVISTLVRYWQQPHYRVHDDGRTRPDPKYVVETPDGYAVIVRAFARGDHLDFTLSSSSPCIWPNGTPNPQ